MKILNIKSDEHKDRKKRKTIDQKYQELKINTTTHISYIKNIVRILFSENYGVYWIVPLQKTTIMHEQNTKPTNLKSNEEQIEGGRCQ